VSGNGNSERTAMPPRVVAASEGDKSPPSAASVIAALRAALSKCPEDVPMVIEPHGPDGTEALYLGRTYGTARDPFSARHGLNIVHLVEPASQWPAVRAAIPTLWNAAPALLSIAEASQSVLAYATKPDFAPHEIARMADALASLAAALAALGEVQP
jgi:hypothetical protein